MKEEKQITSQFDNDPLLKLKSREVDLRAMENERKKDNDEAQSRFARARLMQQRYCRRKTGSKRRFSKITSWS